MSSTQARDRAAHLAKRDTKAALAAARGVQDPWYRAQALAWVARFAPDSEFQRLVRESLSACRECADQYKATGASAWPLRVLVERGSPERCRRELSAVLEGLPQVEPAASRSEAAFLLFQATFELGPDVRISLLRKLEAASGAGGHWRSQRNLIDAVAMLHRTDAEVSVATAEAITDDKTRRRALKALAEPEPRMPRSFFR